MDIIFVLIFLFICFCAGSIKKSGYSLSAAVEKISTGFIILSFINYFLLLLGLFEKNVIAAVYISVIVLGFNKDMLNCFNIVKQKILCFENKKFLYASLFIFIFYFLNTRAPVTGWDALSYHLPRVRIFLENHKFILREDILNYSFPFIAELNYAFFVMFSRETAIAALQVVFLMFTGYYLYLSSIKLKINKFIAPLVFFITLSFIRLYAHVKPDIFLIFFASAALYYCLVGRFKKFALFLSYTAVIKYNFAVLLIAFLPLSLYKFKLKKTALLILAVLIVFTAASAHNIANYKNPFYPFMEGVFNPQTVSPEAPLDYRLVGQYSDKKHGKPFISAFIFPLEVFIDFQKYDYWKYAIGIHYFILLSAAVFIWKKIKFKIWLLLLSYLLFAYTTYFLVPAARYVLPGLVFLSVFIGAVYEYADRELKKILKCFIIFQFFIFIVYGSAYIYVKFPVIIGKQSYETYLKIRNPQYNSIMHLNTLALRREKTLMVDKKTYYLNSRYLALYPDHRRNPYLKNLRDIRSFWLLILNQKIHYIYFAKNYSNHKIHEFIKILFKEGHITLIYSDSYAEIYAVNYDIRY